MKYLIAALILLPFATFAGGINDYKGSEAPVELNDNWPGNSISKIELDLSSEDVKVKVINGNDITFRYYGDISGLNVNPEDFISREVRSNTLTIKRKPGKLFMRKYNMNVELGIPSMYLEKFSIDLSSGDIEIDEIKADDIMIKTSSGEVEIEYAEADKFNFNSSSGSLEGNTILSNNSDLETSSGDSTIDFFYGDLKARASSGNIEISCVEYKNESIYASASSGNITLTFPDDSNFDLDLDTSSGNTEVDFQIVMSGNFSKDSIKGKIGEGGGLVKANTSSGDINILSQ